MLVGCPGRNRLRFSKPSGITGHGWFEWKGSYDGGDGVCFARPNGADAYDPWSSGGQAREEPQETLCADINTWAQGNGGHTATFYIGRTYHASKFDTQTKCEGSGGNAQYCSVTGARYDVDNSTCAGIGGSCQNTDGCMGCRAPGMVRWSILTATSSINRASATRAARRARATARLATRTWRVSTFASTKLRRDSISALTCLGPRVRTSPPRCARIIPRRTRSRTTSRTFSLAAATKRPRSAITRLSARRPVVHGAYASAIRFATSTRTSIRKPAKFSPTPAKSTWIPIACTCARALPIATTNGDIAGTICAITSAITASITRSRQNLPLRPRRRMAHDQRDHPEDNFCRAMSSARADAPSGAASGSAMRQNVARAAEPCDPGASGPPVLGSPPRWSPAAARGRRALWNRQACGPRRSTSGASATSSAPSKRSSTTRRRQPSPFACTARLATLWRSSLRCAAARPRRSAAWRSMQDYNSATCRSTTAPPPRLAAREAPTSRSTRTRSMASDRCVR